jgi:hypothetical protein
VHGRLPGQWQLDGASPRWVGTAVEQLAKPDSDITMLGPEEVRTRSVKKCGQPEREPGVGQEANGWK